MPWQRLAVGIILIERTWRACTSTSVDHAFSSGVIPYFLGTGVIPTLSTRVKFRKMMGPGDFHADQIIIGASAQIVKYCKPHKTCNISWICSISLAGTSHDIYG